MYIKVTLAPIHLNGFGSTANDNAEPFTPRSIKDLLCDGCGKVAATRFGMCEPCIEAAAAEVEERRNWRPENER
jgi:hypothetical protein